MKIYYGRAVYNQKEINAVIRVLKKKLQKDGLFRDLRLRQHYEKPSLKKQRKLKESLRRIAKEKRLKRLKEGD